MTVPLRGSSRRGLPRWFKQPIPGEEARALRDYLRHNRINTVCKNAHCPNISECFAAGKAAFMILGNRCSRSCSFCAVEKLQGPSAIDRDEPRRVAEAVRYLNLRYVVITSPSRDDLKDGGAGQFARTVKETKALNPSAKIEALIPDFNGSESSLKTVLEAGLGCLAHNIETVPRLYPKVRQGADYTISLRVLRNSKDLDPLIITKSSIMLGLSEDKQEVLGAIGDLRAAGCDILTLGQYLAPSESSFPTYRFITPGEFKEYEKAAYDSGFKAVFSGPKVRSSYLAEEIYAQMNRSRNIGLLGD